MLPAPPLLFPNTTEHQPHVFSLAVTITSQVSEQADLMFHSKYSGLCGLVM